jgi:hypothetical protein
MAAILVTAPFVVKKLTAISVLTSSTPAFAVTMPKAIHPTRPVPGGDSSASTRIASTSE